MIYNITKIELHQVPEGKRNAGSYFLKFLARNPNNRMDKGEVTELDEDWVADYVDYLQLAEPDGVDQWNQPKFKPSKLKDESKPLPEDLLKAPYTQFEQYLTPGGEEYVLVDDDGVPRKNERGQYITTRCVYVFTWKKVDNQSGLESYIKGRDPITLGSRLLARYYKPLKEFTANENTGIVLPQGTDAPLINGESAPAATAPAPAPASTTPPAAAPAV